MAILAQSSPVFQRAMRIIATVTSGNPTEITTTFEHQYITGMIVRLHIPPGYGMVQANNLTGTITVINDVSFYIDIDTTYFDEFAYPGTFPQDRQYPQVTPVGELNSTLLAATQNVLPYSAS